MMRSGPSKVDIFKQNQKEIDGKNPIPVSSLTFNPQEQGVFETETTWIEDFNQNEEWID